MITTIFYKCCNNRKKIRKREGEEKRKIDKKERFQMTTEANKMTEKERKNQDYDNIF